MINNDDYDSEEGEEEDLDEEDLIIQAAATATIAASLSAMEYAQTYYNKRRYHDSALLGIAWVWSSWWAILSRYGRSLGSTNMYSML